MMKHFRPYKLIQVVIMLFLEIACFCLTIILSHSDGILSPPYLFPLLLICLLLVFMITFICILYDLSLFQKMSLDYFDVNKIAYLDQLTGTSNRNSFDLLLRDFASSEELSEIGCIAFSLINLPAINETKGYKFGDEIIRDFAEILSTISEPFGIFGRNSGNEFIIVMRQCDRSKISALLDELNIQIYTHNGLLDYQGISYDYGYVLNKVEHFDSVSKVIALSIQRIVDKRH